MSKIISNLHMYNILRINILVHVLTFGGILRSSKFLSSPNEKEAIVGVGPKMPALSQCQPMLSWLSLYRLVTRELNSSPVSSSSRDFNCSSDLGHS